MYLIVRMVFTLHREILAVSFLVGDKTAKLNILKNYIYMTYVTDI